jgi:hypothetical protein
MNQSNRKRVVSRWSSLSEFSKEESNVTLQESDRDYWRENPPARSETTTPVRNMNILWKNFRRTTVEKYFGASMIDQQLAVDALLTLGTPVVLNIVPVDNFLFKDSSTNIINAFIQ